MTEVEKLGKLTLWIEPEAASADLLAMLLSASAEIVLGRLYPMGVPEGATVPDRYALTQIQIAVELFSKMGAEGQISHSENGIARTWEAADVSPSLLKRIVPFAGSVITSATAAPEST